MTALAAATRALRRFDARLDERIDTRALALLRIALGPIVLLHLRPFRELAGQGLAYDDLFHQPYWSWFPQVGGDAYLLLLDVATVTAVLMSLGVATRWTTGFTAAFVGYNLFVNQLHFVHNRAFLLILLVGVSLLRTGRELSVDAWIRRRLGRPPPMPPRYGVLALLRFEVALVYVASGVSKLVDPDWWGGLVGLIRMERAVPELLDLGLPGWAIDLLTSPSFHSAGAKLAVALELFIGLGLLAPRLRRHAVLAAIPFHVAIELVASVQVFSYAALAALLIWADPFTTGRRAPASGATPAPRTIEPIPAADHGPVL